MAIVGGFKASPTVFFTPTNGEVAMTSAVSLFAIASPWRPAP